MKCAPALTSMILAIQLSVLATAAAATTSTQAPAPADKLKTQILSLQVTEKGFEPASLSVNPGTPVTLQITRNTDETCAKAIKIPSRKIARDLPLRKTVSIDLGILEKGEIAFACGMDMMSGHIIVR